MEQKQVDNLKTLCGFFEEAIEKAIADAYEYIIRVVNEYGGALKTPASSDKTHLYAFYEDYEGRQVAVAIQGLRWDDELGLCICTNDMLDNYQFDNDYCFEYYFDFEGEDLENLNKALDDPAYYVVFDQYDLLFSETVRAIIGGLADYLA